MSMDAEDAGGGASGADAGLKSLISLNGLDYRMAPSLSVATSRTLRAWATNRATYTKGETISIGLSPGSAYVDPVGSYLSFKIKVTDTATNWMFTHESATSLFDSMRLTHASGYEIDRTSSQMGLWGALRRPHTRSNKWTETVGALMAGSGSVLYSRDHLVADTILVQIPLSEISDLFNSDRLLPPFLLAGARIELALHADPKIAFKGETASAFDITDMRVNLEVVTLTDAALRALAATSASSGLEISFERVHHQPVSLGGLATGSATAQVTKSVSRANRVVACITSTASGGVTNGNKFTSIQAKLGSEWLPSAPLTDTPAMFHQTCVSWGGGVRSGAVGQTFADFASAFVAPTVSVASVGGATAVSITLEKSSTLAQSGSPIAANRDLTLDMAWDGAETVGQIHVFVPHVALVSVFLDSVIVRS